MARDLNDLQNKVERATRELNSLRSSVEDTLDEFETCLDDIRDDVLTVEHRIQRDDWKSLKNEYPYKQDAPIDSPVNQREVEYFCWIAGTTEYDGGAHEATFRTIARANVIPVGAIAFRELDGDPNPERF